MKSLIITSFLFLVPLFSFSQVSFDGGTGFLQGFGATKGFTNLHLGIEIPRATDQSIYGRFSYFFPVKEQDLLTQVYSTDINIVPYTLDVNYNLSTNYSIFEGGTRRYIGNDYDYGFSGYSGTNVMLIINKVKSTFSSTSTTGKPWENDYILDPALEPREGTILSFALGLQGGIKYTFPAVGTVYADLSGQYVLFGLASNNTASSSALLSNLFFIFNVGFRKDLY
jgi:hypothetical protein